jgi:hypothetical protein
MDHGDLLVFRKALRDLQGLVPAQDRRHEYRYSPAGSLSHALVCLDGSGSFLDADVVDLSASGMRLAIGPGLNCREGDRCTIEIQPQERRLLRLDGEVRWVQSHRLITVFGVLLDPDNTLLQPV